jgi:type I restriction enzyme, R subunit
MPRSLPRLSGQGRIFVFVDECHRTQSGKLHEAMKEILPDAMFIGFTGTPLLKSRQAAEHRGVRPYIHTYKYDEAVKDGVVLDLRYEARDIDQTSPPRPRSTSGSSQDQGADDVAKAQLKQRWGTMQKVLSSRSRWRRSSPTSCWTWRRATGSERHGNALLVSDSI